MENGSNSRELKSVIGHDQGTFDRWLASSAIIGSLFATAIVAMALAGSFSTNSPKAAIASSERTSSPVATDGVSK